MTRWNMISGSPVWVGLKNYINLFTSSQFHQVLLNTLVFGGVVVIGSVVIGLALAVLINQKLRLRGIVRTAAFAPSVISGAAVARSEEHTSELQSRRHLVCRLLPAKKTP